MPNVFTMNKLANRPSVKTRASWGAVLVLLILVGFTSPGLAQTNLVVNAGFESNAPAAIPAGWSALWMRDPGSGTMTLDSAVPHGGHAALKVEHHGERDWSVEQEAPVRVEVGDIFEIGTWVKTENAGDVQISVVTRNAKGDTLEWQFGGIEVGGTHAWQEFSRKIVVPAGCATIQFRFTGMGKGTSWFDDARLVKTGNIHLIGDKFKSKTLAIQNQTLRVSLESANGQLTVFDKRIKRAWRQEAFTGGILVTDARLDGPQTIRMALWDVVNDLKLQGVVILRPDAPEFTLALDGKGAVSEPVAFPQPLKSSPGAWLVVPLNEGILYAADDATVYPMELPAYSGHGICMPWYGVIDSQDGPGVMAIIRTPDDARVEITRRLGEALCIRPKWDAQRGQFGYERRLTYVVFSKGGYIAQAKRYRDFVQHTGLFKSLAQKRHENPNVDKLIGAVNVWNWDMDKVALCREMKDLGMTNVLWSNAGTPDEVSAINKLGYLTSTYDIYQDVHPTGSRTGLDTAGWPDDLVLSPNGDWVRGWEDRLHNSDGTDTITPGGIICSSRGLLRAEARIPADLKTHPYTCRFIDTTTAAPWIECANPKHPQTRSADRQNKMALLDFCSHAMKLVTGSETGLDAAVPYVDYFEGMLSLGPYRLPDAGRDLMMYKQPTPEFYKYQVGSTFRVPLWELVYHDAVVSHWYWGDYTNRVPDAWERRDLFNILYGTPPMFLFDKAAWDSNKTHFERSYRNICPLVRRVGYDEMLSHRFLNPEHTVQATRWSSGLEVIVNFGDVAYRLPDGGMVEPMGWVVGKAQDQATPKTAPHGHKAAGKPRTH